MRGKGYTQKNHRIIKENHFSIESGFKNHSTILLFLGKLLALFHL
jgi:hypothetical protein